MSFPKFCVFYKKMSSPPQILVLYTCTFVTILYIWGVSCRHRRTVIFLVRVATQSMPKKRRKKSRRAGCLAGRGKTIIFLFYQRVNSYTKRFLERFETGAICNSCVFSSHTFLNCLNGFLLGIVSEKLIF